MMKKSNVVKNGFSALYIFVIFFLTFYGSYFWPFGPFLRYGAIVLGIILPIIIDKKFYHTKEFVCFLLYALVIYLNYLSGDENYINIKLTLLSCSAIIISIPMTHYLLINKNLIQCRNIVYTTIVVILWTSIATGIIDSTFPGVVRYAQNTLFLGEEDVSSFAAFYRNGMSNYLLPHALPMMIPPFVMILRIGRIKFAQRILSISVILSILALLYFSGATGPLLLGALILILSMVVRPGNASSNIKKVVVICLLTLPFLLSDEIMLSLLNWIDGLIGGEGYFHSKVIAMQDTIMTGENQGDFGEREKLYQTGVADAFESPIWGTQEKVAGHSVLLNIFGKLGIIGFLPFIIMLINHVKFVKRGISSWLRIYYYIGLLAAFMMLALKGIECWEIWFAFFAFLPISIVYFSQFQENATKD